MMSRYDSPSPFHHSYDHRITKDSTCPSCQARHPPFKDVRHGDVTRTTVRSGLNCPRCGHGTFSTGHHGR